MSLAKIAQSRWPLIQIDTFKAIGALVFNVNSREKPRVKILLQPTIFSVVHLSIMEGNYCLKFDQHSTVLHVTNLKKLAAEVPESPPNP